MTAKASIEHSLTDIHSQALAKKKKRKKKASTHKFEALFSAVSAFFLFIFMYTSLWNSSGAVWLHCYQGYVLMARCCSAYLVLECSRNISFSVSCDPFPQVRTALPSRTVRNIGTIVRKAIQQLCYVSSILSNLQPSHKLNMITLIAANEWKKNQHLLKLNSSYMQLIVTIFYTVYSR